MEKHRVAPIKQVVWFTIISYMGTAIGIVSSLLLYPKNLEFQGIVRYIDSIAQLLFPIMVFGASQALIKFYPAISEERQKQLFNYSLVSVGVISVFVFLGIVSYEGFGDPQYKGLVYFAFPVAVSLAFVELFKKQLQDLQKIALPAMFEKLIPKIVLPIAFLLLIYANYTRDAVLAIYVAGYVLILVFTAIYLFKRYKPTLNYRFKTLFGEISRKEYFRYSLFSLAGSLGSLLAFRIDGLIIPKMISMEANGIFSIGAILATTLQIPAVGLFALYAPIISNYLKDQDFLRLNIKYKETARLLFFIGAVLYGCIFLGLEDLFRLMPDYNKLQATIPIIKILGFSVLINMATGFNGEIITYSKYYRFNLVSVFLLIAVTVVLNIYFINAGYGIEGVAWASFISMTLFNVSKLLFIYKKFGILPFDKKFLTMAAIFTVLGIFIYILPETGSHFLNVTYKVFAYTGLTVLVLYKLKLVYQVNVSIDNILGRIRK